ncbi:MAG: L-tyrosine/L-tryptophan isonitrile synthase family protein [Alphaproteobacteria bacterium]|nr:L-tyrosine/L-tryptophan isonitrile synthase family protein [Alphaproteobacteria bacterium]
MNVRRHPNGLNYRASLDNFEEAVISSHFMADLSKDLGLRLYDNDEFWSKSTTIASRAVAESLIPSLRRSASAFAHERACAARLRAMRNHASYGLTHPSQAGASEFITEILFDRQFRDGGLETCSRQALRNEIALRISAGSPIEMAIPALPHKFSCPLKTRGILPDLSDVDFILGLYEIVAAVEELYREDQRKLPKPLARFTIVSDGTRFSELTNESEVGINAYREALARWIEVLQLQDYVELIEYRKLLRDRLPEAAQITKGVLRQRALRDYTSAMSAIFNPSNMTATLREAAIRAPDPECNNPEGRFVSLFKSLIFIVRYHTLDRLHSLSPAQFRDLYRELTSHLCEPFVTLTGDELKEAGEELARCGARVEAAAVKEYLRRAMLKEVWDSTIAYIAEIKSDREQGCDPVSRCLPNHLRWTIHAKPGQLGLRTPSALGKRVLAWAGAAVFKRTKFGGIRLCTLPVLALEGAGAIPVLVADRVRGEIEQPFFYLYPDIAFTGISGFLEELSTHLIRRRAR